MMTDLKNLRKMTGLTQYDLARESGLPRWKVSLIEALQVEPSPAEEAALRGTIGKSLQSFAVKAAEVGHQQVRAVAV
jgi:predicted transcriptional regulator